MAKQTLTLVFKKQLIPKTHFLVFKSENTNDFKPGQFFSLEIAPKTNRAYSTVYCGQKTPSYFAEMEDLENLNEGSYVAFMISTKPGGEASTYFENIQVGTELSAIGPAGKFTLADNNKPKVFVATGTGLAPFVPMIEKVFAQNSQAEVSVFFGVWEKNSDFAKEFLAKYLTPSYPNFKFYTVIDDFKPEELDDSHLGGRVTNIIPEIIKDYINTDYYLCGHPAMVSAMEEVLLGLGAKDNVFKEKFGK